MDSAITIGTFDGVHAGHRFLLDNLRREASLRGLTPVVLTLDRHPLAALAPGKEPPALTTLPRRMDLIREAGIDNVYALEFNAHTCALTARRFMEEVVIPQYNPRLLLLGYDSGFGADRLRGMEQYTAALDGLGIEVGQCPPMPGSAVSSTDIRRALATGCIADANAMLGRPFSITGTVQHGKQLGRTIGYPTANIGVDPAMALPADGVYAASLGGYPVMLNIGTAPTVNTSGHNGRTVEAHIIGLDSDTNLYGKQLTINVLERLRDERKFSSLEHLRQALDNDRLATLAIAGNFKA